jgi:hypothetical protein
MDNLIRGYIMSNNHTDYNNIDKMEKGMLNSHDTYEHEVVHNRNFYNRIVNIFKLFYK